MTAKGFRITGRHVLVGMIVFFTTIIVVNAIFITLAVRSYPGEKERKSYMQGLAFNERLAERELQAALGWTAGIERFEVRASGASGKGRVLVDLVFRTRTGEPIYDLSIEGGLARPASDAADAILVFRSVEPGLYRAEAAADGPGAYILTARAVGPHGERFAFETRVLADQIHE